MVFIINGESRVVFPAALPAGIFELLYGLSLPISGEGEGEGEEAAAAAAADMATPGLSLPISGEDEGEGKEAAATAAADTAAPTDTVAAGDVRAETHQPRKYIQGIYKETVGKGEKAREFTVPTSHKLVLTSRYNMILSSHKHLKKLKKCLCTDKFTGSPLFHHLICAGLGSVPYIGYEAVEALLAFIRGGLVLDLADAGLQTNADKLAKASSGKTTLRNIMLDGCADSVLLLVCGLIDGRVRHIFISVDHGNHDRIDHFVKVISFYYQIEQRVVSCCLDVDPCGHTASECAHAIKHSLEKLCGVSVVLQGITRDVGGGGVLSMSILCASNQI